MNYYDIIVLGGGPAGITIAKALKGKKQVAIVRPEEHSMIYCAMPYVLEDILDVQKTFKQDSIVTNTGAKLIRSKAIKVDFEQKLITLEDDQVLKYEKLVIATGAKPIIPNIKGSDLEGVTVFKTEEDLLKIKELVDKKDSPAIVVGAGAVGIELAQSLKSRGLEVHLLDMASNILPNLMDEDMIIPVKEKIKELGINFHLNVMIKEIVGDTRAKLIKMNSGDCISLYKRGKPNCGFITFCIGMRPEVSLFEDTKLKISDSGIIVNEYMQTNIENVYAVGDVAEYKCAITGDLLSGKLATNAVPMANIAADNILGKNTSYQGFFNGAATKIDNYYVGATGINEFIAKKKEIPYLKGYSELTTAFPIMDIAKKVKVKLIAHKNTHKILGAQVVSELPVTDKIDLITLAIQSGLTVEQLSQLSYSAQPYQSFFPANNIWIESSKKILEQILK